MRYFAQYNENNKLIAIGTGNCGVEITELEYISLLSEIREKAAFVDSLYSGEISIDAVPEAWREEIQIRVNERIADESDLKEAEATEADYLAALAEVGVTVNEEI